MNKEQEIKLAYLLDLIKLFREYREKYPDANFDDAIGLLAGDKGAINLLKQ